MNLLFICKYNIFRSKVAEAYFKKINNNKNIKVDSAGIKPKGIPLDKNEFFTIKRFGIKVYGKPKMLDEKLLEWQDVTVIVANDVPPEAIEKKYRKKLLVWKIPDITDNIKITEIVSRIVERVEKLVKELEEEK